MDGAATGNLLSFLIVGVETCRHAKGPVLGVKVAVVHVEERRMIGGFFVILRIVVGMRAIPPLQILVAVVRIGLKVVERPVADIDTEQMPITRFSLCLCAQCDHYTNQ